MRAAKLITVLFLATALVSLPGEAANENDVDNSMARLPDWSFDGSWELEEVPEPSGLCYCPPRDSLFIVDDGGLNRPPAVYEMDLEAEVLAKREIGVDLEGICYCSFDGLLYVADEADEVVYVLQPEGLELVGEFTFAASIDGEPLLVPGGNGIEGIEYVPVLDAGHFLLLNQDDPHAIVRISYQSAREALSSVESAPLEACWLLPAINLGELHYDSAASELWVVHSWMNVMEILDVPSMQLKRWEVVPGAAQEAVAVDGEGRLWIGSDNGGIDRYVRPGNTVQSAE